MAAALFTVSGKVQGVWFRASTREQALQLGLAGHAKNLDDGRVQVLAVGDADALDQLPDHAVPDTKIDFPPLATKPGKERYAGPVKPIKGKYS